MGGVIVGEFSVASPVKLGATLSIVSSAPLHAGFSVNAGWGDSSFGSTLEQCASLVPSAF